MNADNFEQNTACTAPADIRHDWRIVCRALVAGVRILPAEHIWQ